MYVDKIESVAYLPTRRVGDRGEGPHGRTLGRGRGSSARQRVRLRGPAARRPPRAHCHAVFPWHADKDPHHCPPPRPRAVGACRQAHPGSPREWLARPHPGRPRSVATALAQLPRSRVTSKGYGRCLQSSAHNLHAYMRIAGGSAGAWPRGKRCCLFAAIWVSGRAGGATEGERKIGADLRAVNGRKVSAVTHCHSRRLPSRTPPGHRRRTRWIRPGPPSSDVANAPCRAGAIRPPCATSDGAPSGCRWRR